MAKNGNKKGARRVRKGAKRIPRKRSAPSKTFAKKVQKVISKNVESKVSVYTSPSMVPLNQFLDTSNDCLRLIPFVPNGTAQNQKLGTEIRVQSINFRGHLIFTIPQTSVNKTRIGVRFTILRGKRFNDWQAAQTDFTANYTRLLEGVITGNQGTVAQFNTPINKDYFSTVMDKRFYMSQSLNPAATTGYATSQTCKLLNFNIPYSRRKLIFEDGLDIDDPVNYPYFLLVNWCMLDGSAVTAPGDTSLSLQYTTTMKYEDA